MTEDATCTILLRVWSFSENDNYLNCWNQAVSQHSFTSPLDMMSLALTRTARSGSKFEEEDILTGWGAV